MAINVADNFSYKGGKPLDARIKYDTITAMVNTPTADLYDGCLAYVTAEKKNYQYDSSNAVDPTLGKWREFEGGGGGGHTIEDADGITLTQRDILKFGEGFAVSDDSTNEKTVVNLNPMPDTDMSDVLDPLPSIPTRYHKYSTTEQVVGEWIDGRPIYEKTVEVTTPTVTEAGISMYNSIQLGVSIDIAIMCKVITSTSDGTNIIIPDVYGNRATVTISGTQVYSNAALSIRAFVRTNSYSSDPNTITIGTNSTAFSNRSGYAIVQYIKTTN